MLTLAETVAPAPLTSVEPVIFYLCAALVILSAWAIVMTQNVVRMAVYLLLTLSGAAALYFMLQAEFLAAIQLIVYAGGTLILIVFGVMLTSKNPAMQLKTKPWERMIGVIIGLIMVGLLLLSLVHTNIHQAVAPEGDATTTSYQVEALGKALLTSYLVPFEVTAVLLLIVMIGAAYMARRRAK